MSRSSPLDKQLKPFLFTLLNFKPRTIHILLLFLIFLVHQVSKVVRPSSSAAAGDSNAFDSSSLVYDQNHKPLVSIIITTYNVERYIEATLRATLRQSYPQFEIILVDDASTDATTDVARKVARGSAKVRMVQLPVRTLGGVGTPGNLGLKEARGEFVTFVDGDDVPHRNFISKMVEVAKRTGAEVTMCQFTIVNDTTNHRQRPYDGMYWPKGRLVELSQNEPVSAVKHSKVFAMAPVPWRKLYRRDFLQHHEIRFPEVDFLYEDNAFHWNVLMHATRISFLGETLVDHKVGRKEQTTNTLQVESTGQRNAEDALEAAMRGADAVKYIPNMNLIGRQLTACSIKGFDIEHCLVAKKEFLEYLNRTGWLLHRIPEETHPKLVKKVNSIFFKTSSKWQHVLGNGTSKMNMELVVDEVLLSIVFSIENDKHHIPQMLRLLRNVTVSHEVIFVDNHSTDDSLAMLSKMTESVSNWFVIRDKEYGIGRNRNFAQLLCEGRYVIFLSGRDTFNPIALNEATHYSAANGLDVLVLRNEPEKVAATEKHINEMEHKNWEWDAESRRPIHSRKLFALKQGHLASKLIKRDLLVQNNVFHGPTILVNNVQFDWHVILSARSVEVMQKPIVVRSGVPYDLHLDMEEYLAIPSALTLANRVLASNRLLQSKEIHTEWLHLCMGILQRNRDHTHNSRRREYGRRSRILKRLIKSHRINLL